MALQGPPGQLWRFATPTFGRGSFGLVHRNVHVSGKLLASAVFDKSEFVIEVPFFDVFVNPFRLVQTLNLIVGVLPIDGHGGVLYKEVFQGVRGFSTVGVARGALECRSRCDDPG